MEMPEVKAFNAELSGLYDNKPPISKAKMSAITKGAIKAIKVYKHVVHSVEKFIQKCKPEYKVPGLYVIDSIVRQSRHQFGQDKDVFAPRFAKNMQQTFANLFRCPPEDKRNIIRVLNLWQKNHVFSAEVIQPLMDMADPSHPLHQEIEKQQQQQNNTANGSSMNISHNTSDNKLSPGAGQHSPHMSSPMGGDQFQDEPSGQPNLKFNRKLLNDFEYDSEDEQMMDVAPLPPHSSHSHTSHSASHTSHSGTYTSHSGSHTTHTSSQGHMQNQQQQVNQNPADAMASILTNPEIMRQLHSLQAQMQMMTGMQLPNLMPMMSDMQQMQQNQNQQNLPFLSSQQDQQKNDAKDDQGNNESDIEFVDSGPTVIEIPDANDSSPSPKSRRHRSRSKSPRRRGRRPSRSRTRSRSPRRRRDRDRDRERDRDRDKDREKSYKEREAEREKQREREKKGLPPIKKENLSVCSTTLWVGHLSKLATPEELSDLFGAVGGVASIDVVPPRGCAFVVMERRRDAYKAKLKLNKHKLHSKEITVAWAPGKGVKGREWKDYWEAELGVSYLPWSELHARWTLGALSLDAFEDGGACDEDTLPPWLPPRILPKTMLDNMSMMSVGMLPMPPGLPPRTAPPDLSGGTMGSPLPGGTLAMPPTSAAMPTMPAMPAMPSMPNMPMPRMPPPGMPTGMPPGMAPGLPPGVRPPSIPTGVTGLQTDAGLPPNPLIRFPPGIPPQSMPQPGMVGGFLGGLLGVGGLMGGVPVLHLPPARQVAVESNPSDDAMELEQEEATDGGDSRPALLPDQIQALLSKPPPAFNASEPPPGFNAAEPPPFAPPPAADRQDDERRERDRDTRRERDRDRGDRRERDRDTRRDRDRDNRRERPPRGERDRDVARDERRDRGDRDRGGRRDRDRGDRERERFGPNRDNNNRTSREKSPRQPLTDAPEKSLQERLWEMANGKPAAEAPRVEDPPRDQASAPERPEPGAARREGGAPGDMDNDVETSEPSGADGDGWAPPSARPPLLGPPYRAELRLRMRGPPRQPMAGPGPWMEGPPFGARFNGMGPPPFNRPPFERPPFDGPPRFERPPFNRMPFDMNRPPFDGPRPPFDGPRPPFDGPRQPFDGPRPPFDGPRPPFDGPRQFDGDRQFDGPPEFFERNNRRFDEREPPFNERAWSGDRDRDREWRPDRGEWRDRGDRGARPPQRRGFDERARGDRAHDRQRDRSREDRARDDRPREDRPRDDKPRDERPRDDKPRDDRPREDRPKDERPREDRPRDDRTRDERSREDRPRDERPREERRRDKDRKSRWGAAEEPPAEEPTPAESNAETAEITTSADEPQPDADTQPAEDTFSERIDPMADEPKADIPMPSDDDFKMPSDDDARMPSDDDARVPSTFDDDRMPAVVEARMSIDDVQAPSFDEPQETIPPEPREEATNEIEESEMRSAPVAAPADEPTADLYDATEEIDTSFAEEPPSEPPAAPADTSFAEEPPSEPPAAPAAEEPPAASDDIFERAAPEPAPPDAREGAA